MLVGQCDTEAYTLYIHTKVLRTLFENSLIKNFGGRDVRTRACEGLHRSDLSAPGYCSLNRSCVAADISISVVVGVANAGGSVGRPEGLHCAIDDADGACDDDL